MIAAKSDDGLLRTELRALRLGAGATPERIAAHGEVYLRLGEPPLSDAVNVLRERMRALGDGVAAQALTSAFALEEGTDRRLAGRRTAFARKSGLLPDDIERHEAAAINQLVDLLLQPPPP